MAAAVHHHRMHTGDIVKWLAIEFICLAAVVLGAIFAVFATAS